MPSTVSDVINYIPRRAALPDKPRKVSLSITLTAEGLSHTSMPVEKLDNLIALEFERARQLADIANENEDDASECAAADLHHEFQAHTAL